MLEKLTPYKAGPTLAEIAARYRLNHLARLAANEWPQGPFPEVVAALKTALDDLNRYPDGRCSGLRRLIAERLTVPEECLVFGNGSCEVLMLLGHAFLGPDRGVVFPHPSFVMYRAIAVAQGAPYTAVALPGLDYDVKAMLEAIDSQTSLVIICNPNNPTGSYLEPPQVRAFLERVPDDVVVVLDEAYREFVDPQPAEDSARWISKHRNLVVVRTFSKIYGLAGLRVGYAIADPQIVEALDKLRQPFNVDSLAQLAALESLRHPERLRERQRHVARERARVAAALADMGIGYHPSQANFLLVDVTGLAVPPALVPQALLARGVLTRSGQAMGCPGYVRVTIGEVEDNDLFLS
ncbi:MAG: histidinol-phosphate transaminase, partial [Thermoleophilia bacterium]|nr:histidinol-phosphate transaminase [Thermoleophilia bacterium]